MKFLKQISFFLLILLCYKVSAQFSENNFNNLKFKHYTTTQGLSQGSVIDIHQDKTGYLWFGTREGLNKFDGTKFKTFRYNSEESSSLSDSWVTCIYQDSKENLWVGTKKGLNQYNPELENFSAAEKWTDRTELNKLEIWGITQYRDSLLLISTSSGIAKINLFNKKTTFLLSSNKNSNSISNDRTRSIFNAENGSIWICTIENIEKFDIEKNIWSHYNYPKGATQNNNRTSSPKIFKDSQGNVWCGYENGLAKLNEQKNIFEDYRINGVNPITNEVRAFCEDKFNNLWIGTYKGLRILNHSEKTIKTIVHDENNPTSLSQNSIYKILKDRKGDLWIGTWAGGINYFDYSYDIFKHIPAGPVKSMLNYKVISSIIETKENNLWIGTEGGGLNYLDKTTGVFTYYTNKKNDKTSISSNNIKSMIQDHSGNLWIGTHDGGLNFLDTSKSKFYFEHFDRPQKNGITVADKRILAILEDSNHNIWIGTLTNGLLHYDTKRKEFIKLNYSLKSINAIYQSDNPEILFITGSQGLEKININTKVISKIPIDYSNDSNTTVNCVYQHDDQTIWIGTEGDGLFSYNIKTKQTKKYGIKQGLLNEVIYGILSDSENNLWFSTNSGISRLNLESEEVKNFDESDGLQGSEFNYGAFSKAKNGMLYFGGTNGLNYFDPSKISENKYVPTVDIYKMRVSNKPYKILTKQTSIIDLNYNQNDFSFEFTALNFSQANKNQFAYKLEGFDNDWNYIGNNKTATYTNIDQGEYTFRVKASNNDNHWNDIGDAIVIQIQPAPWKTTWAYLCYLLFISILSYATYALIKVRNKEKNELKKEKINRERLEEVNQMKLKLFTNISHDFRTPLTLIIGPLQRMIENNMGNDFVQKQHITMQRNANMLLQLITQLLDFRKSESGKLELHASKSNIVTFTEEIKLAFEDLAKVKNITYNFTSEKKEIDLWFDKIKMKKILFNLLSNAFKYTQDDSEIKIHIESNNSEVIISITNFGEEIPKKNIKYVFDRYYRSDQDEFKSGSGIGLALTKSLVDLHKGTISVTSSQKEGTTFRAKFLLEDHHIKSSEKLISPKNSGSIYEDQPESQSHSPEAVSSIDNSISIDENKATLLVVEDNSDVRNFIKEIFENKYNIYTAENGNSAITIANNKEIDLIISDIMMPVMDGLELCKQIKSNITTSHIPIILLTAKTDAAHQKDGYQFGADAYITKPFDASILEVRVDNLLNTRTNLISKFKKDIILTPKELTVTSADELFLEKAIKIIEENITDPEFNVHVFTKQMSMSRSVLYRKFKALTNQSITEFIRTIKLKKAGQLIANTKMHISEIAYEVGFSDLKYFRKCFKAQFNELPSNYRNMHNEKNDE